MNENALLDKALLALKNNTSITSEQQHVSNDHTLSLKKNGVTQTYHIYTKRRPSVSQLALLIHSDKPEAVVVGDTREQYNEVKTLVVADYISTTQSQFLKENQCDFIDSVGNAHLSFGPVFIYITGNKAPKIPAEAKPSRAFQSTGLKLIFSLLCHPEDILNRNYRELSKICGVSLGSIGWIINDLKAAGYISSTANDQRTWVDKERLIKRWVVAYTETLRPKLVLGYYKSLQANWQEKVDISAFSALWGGEIVADNLTHYLKPEFSTIYSQDNLGKLVLMNGLKEVSEKSSANVEVLQKFWHFDDVENTSFVPTLLTYADLIASGDARNLEAARIIHKEFLNVCQ